MARLDTQLYRPPVRLAGAIAAQRNTELQLGSEAVAAGAGNYGEREARFDSVPLALRIDRDAGPNNESGIGGVIPINHTQRKQGFPPVTSIEGEGEGG